MYAAMEERAPGWEQRREAFLERYYISTGDEWQGYYPRGPPLLPIIPAEELGHVHMAHSNHSSTGLLPMDIKVSLSIQTRSSNHQSLVCVLVGGSALLEASTSSASSCAHSA